MVGHNRHKSKTRQPQKALKVRSVRRRSLLPTPVLLDVKIIKSEVFHMLSPIGGRKALFLTT